MTEKKQAILSTALKLFAQNGYDSTSTAKVAQEAGVSEGLIFKHFKNKEGLLEAVLKESAAAAETMLNAVMLAPTPQEKIIKMLELPFKISASQYEMWRLTYALKWQRDSYDNAFKDSIKIVLQDAFTKLGYFDPKAEAELLFMITDGAATSLLLHKPDNPAGLLLALKNKYPI